MNAGRIIRRFKTGDFTVTRRTGGSYTDGVYTPGGESTFSIEASIQPVIGRELQVLPAAFHAAEVRCVWTLTELRTIHPGGDPDRIDISGETWDVIRVQTWPNHYRAYVARQATP